MTRSRFWIGVPLVIGLNAVCSARAEDAPPSASTPTPAEAPKLKPPTKLVAKPVKPVSLGGETTLAVDVTGGGAGAPVTYAVSGDGNGSVDEQGVFHAPKTHATPATVFVVASVGGDAPASIRIAVPLLAVSVSIHPVGKALQVGQSIDLVAEVKGATAEGSGLTWSATGDASIDDKGHLTVASTLKTPASVVVKATSVADSSKVASVTLPVEAIAVVAKAAHAIALGESIELGATVMGASGEAAKVTWSVPEGQGSIDASGKYTAPEHTKTPATIVAKATSVADPTKAASVTLTIPAIAVSVTPAAPTVSVGGAVTVEGKENGKPATLTWSIEGGKEQGEVDAQGKYTAPAAMHTPAKVAVKATSVADPTKSATATIAIAAIGVVAKPAHPIALGESIELGATVTGASGEAAKVTWSVPEGQGSIDASGKYTAPEHTKTPATIVAKATSVADPTKAASVTLTIPVIAVSVTPAAPTVSVGGTVSLEGKENGKPATLTWTLEGGKEQGEIDSQGKYTAPATMHTPAKVVVKATSVADPSKSATATIAIAAIGVVAKAAHPVALGESIELGATVTGASGEAAKVTWSVPEGQGSIDASGKYTAPEHTKTPATIVAKATSVADPTKAASVTLTIPAIAVSVTPAAPTVSVGGTVSLEGKENGKPATLTWTLEGGKDQGEIDAQGKYTAPATMHTPAKVVVKATSVADPSKSATATIAIAAIGVVAKPAHPIALGESIELGATVTGASGEAAKVTWSVPEGQGSIDASGKYTAPEHTKTPATIVAKVASVADPTKAASVTLTIPVIAVSVTPAAPTVSVGGTVSLEGKENGKPATLTWTLEGGKEQGEIDAQGKYTAPAAMHTPAKVAVKATSVADPTKSATATIAIPAIGVVAKPAHPVQLGESIELSAVLTGATGDSSKVTWSVPEGQGSIDASGRYTAPGTYKTPATIMAKVVSVADPTKGATVPVAIPAVTVAVSPAAATVELGGSATFEGKENGKAASLTWSVAQDQGSIDASGKYEPPAQLRTPGHVVIKGTSTADPSKSATATVTIPALSVAIATKALTVELGATAKVEGHVAHAQGDAAKLTWSVTGGEANGTVDPDGTFHAPTVKPSGAAPLIKAVSAADSSQGAAVEVHWVPVVLKVTPEHVRAALGGTVRFSAQVQGASETGVEWTVAGVGCGTIAADGTYTAPKEPPSPTAVKLTARAKADPSRTVTVIADVVGKPEVRTLSPGSAGLGEVITIQGKNFAERGTGSGVLVGGAAVSDADFVSWSPSSIAVKVPAGAHSGKVEVQALGGAASSATDFTLLPAEITVVPTSLLLRQGERHQLVARVSHAGDTRVTWTLEGDTDAAKLYADGTLIANEDLSAIRHVVVRATCAADHARSATASVVLGAQGTVVWEASAEGANGPSADTRGHYFISTRDGNVVAFDANGQRLWRTSVIPPPLADEAPPQVRTPIAAGDLVTTVVQSSGTCVDGRACQSDTAELVALHTSDGSAAWRVSLGEGDFAEAVALADGIAVARYAGTVAAYGLADGKQRWSVRGPKGLLHPPVLGPDGLLHGSGEGGAVFAVTSAGKLAYSVTLPERPGSLSRPAVAADGSSYVVGDDAVLRALDPHGQVRWKASLQGRVPPRTDPTPLLGSDGVLFAVSGSTLEAFSTSGERRWSTPCAACSAPLAQGRDGHLYAGRHGPQSYGTDGKLSWAADSFGEGDRWTPGVLTADGYLLWTDGHGLSARLTSGGAPPAGSPDKH